MLLRVPHGDRRVKVSRGKGGFHFYPLPTEGMGELPLCFHLQVVWAVSCLLNLVSFGDTRMYLYQKLVTKSTVYYFHWVNN